MHLLHGGKIEAQDIYNKSSLWKSGKNNIQGLCLIKVGKVCWNAQIHRDKLHFKG